MTPSDRINAYDGPTIVFDGSSPCEKLTDVMSMGNLGVSRQAREVTDTTHPLCYICQARQQTWDTDVICAID